MSSQEELAKSLEASSEIQNELKDLSIDKLIAMGVEIRDELTVERRKFDKYEASAKGMMARVSMALLEKGRELGVDSFKTAAGTAYKQLKESYRVGDWNQVLAYIKDTGNWQMLEKRVGKLATREIHQSTKAIPPGVEYIAEEEFVIRRPNERSKADE